MKTIDKKFKKGFLVGLEKDIQTEHFPIVVAEGLDVVMKLDGYKRVSQIKNNKEEFIWENKEGIRLAVKYYTQVNSITFSRLFDDLTKNKEDIIKHINTLYNKLDTTIGVISQYLGFPYISTTKELQVEIKGANSAQKAKILIPIIQELYKKVEGIQMFNTDILDQTALSTKILLGILE
ncbi:hypothetical protein HY061_00425 [Candidatus Azambacteria bacterium]|nr:hypothetical protein [Candidatus Azambacteria bacterium]